MPFTVPGLTSGTILGIEDEGVPMPPEHILNFLGDSVTLVDNPGNGSTDVIISVGAGILPLSREFFVDPGTASAIRDGSITDPFLTPAEAEAAAAALPAGPVVIRLAAGTYTNLPLRPPARDLLTYLGSGIDATIIDIIDPAITAGLLWAPTALQGASIQNAMFAHMTIRVALAAQRPIDIVSSTVSPDTMFGVAGSLHVINGLVFDHVNCVGPATCETVRMIGLGRINVLTCDWAGSVAARDGQTTIFNCSLPTFDNACFLGELDFSWDQGVAPVNGFGRSNGLLLRNSTVLSTTAVRAQSRVIFYGTARLLGTLTGVGLSVNGALAPVLSVIAGATVLGSISWALPDLTGATAEINFNGARLGNTSSTFSVAAGAVRASFTGKNAILDTATLSFGNNIDADIRNSYFDPATLTIVGNATVVCSLQSAQDEGVSATTQPRLNFVGAGVTLSNNTGNKSTDVLIPNAEGTILVSPTQAALVTAMAGGTAAAPKRVTVTGVVDLYQMPMPSHVVLDLRDTRVTSTTAPAVGLADDPDNALIYVRGTEVPATLNTTLSAVGHPGDTVITVVALGTLVANDYIVIKANTNTMGTDVAGSSMTNVEIYEVRKVLSIAVGPKQLTLDGPLVMYFGSTGAAPAQVIALTQVENVEIIGGNFDCSGGTIADGISTREAVDVHCYAQTGKGFSRATIEFGPGTMRWLSENYERRGETNCDVFVRAAHEGTVRGMRFKEGLRDHANGYPRGNITTRQRSSASRFEDCQLGSGNVGILMWGGFNNAIDGISFVDLNPTDRIARANADGGTAGIIGTAIDTNCSDLSITDKQWGLHLSGIKVGTVVTPGNPGSSVLLGDIRKGVLSDISINTFGPAATQNGLLISDSFMTIGTVYVSGCARALEYENGAYAISIESVEIVETAGSGASYTGAPIYLNLGIACTLFINRLRISDVAKFVQFGASYPVGNIFEVRNVICDGFAGTIESMYAVKNASTGNKSVGALVMLDPATASQVIDATAGGGPGKFLAVCKGPSDDTSTMAYMMVAVTRPGRQSMVRCDTAIVAPGDLLRHALSGNATADPAATGDAVGVAVTAKAAGAAGLVQTV